MQHVREPIRIAGAGPAGLACAIALAAGGRLVELYEARPQIGGRFDGDHQILPCFGEPPRGLELLAGLGVEADELELTPLREARFLHGERARQLKSEEPYALLIRRGPASGTLDATLARRAERLGVRLCVGQRLAPQRAQVVATGASAVDGLALERLFRTTAADRVDVLLDPGRLRRGYAYLFIRDGQATAGVAALGGYRELDSMLDAALDRFARIQPFDQREPRSAVNAMNFALSRTAVRGGRLYVGEAAGFQDYLFGLGLRCALLSGQLAAQALLENLDYDSLWRHALAPRMRMSAVDRWLYERMARSPGALVSRLARGDLRAGLAALQRPSLVKRALLPWVTWRWMKSGTGRAGKDRSHGRCAHDLPDHRCRPREAPVPVSEEESPAALEARS